MRPHPTFVSVVGGLLVLSGCTTKPCAVRDGNPPPSSAFFLFDGSSTDAWVMARDGSPCRWAIDGAGAGPSAFLSRGAAL